ncbi:MAG TPA: helix-hairpin-helix domain-containing protein [Variovorax sp.]|nr:helix-hairpin-helix domain-containing protein [Variovorax sp.]
MPGAFCDRPEQRNVAPVQEDIREKSMLKKILAGLAMLSAAAAFAAVDANKASLAELDGIKGVGPSMSQRILDARKQGEFKNWDDLMTRVKGVKGKKAERLSAEGLTVNGEAFKAADAAPAAAKPVTLKAVAAKPAASAAPAAKQ